MQAVKKLRAVGQGLVVLVLLMICNTLRTVAQPAVAFDQASVDIVPGPGGGQISGLHYIIDGQDNLYATAGYSGTIQVGPITLTNAAVGQGEMFVAKRSATGVWQWARTVSNGGAANLTTDDLGNLYLVGSFVDTIRFGSIVLYNTQMQQTGSISAFITKLSPAGAWEWAQMIGEYSRIRRGHTIGTGLAVDASGNVAITGTFAAPAVYAGTSLLYNVDSLNRGVTDIFTAKLNSNGQWLWTNSMGTDGGDNPASVLIDGMGNTYLSGVSASVAQLGNSQVRIEPEGNYKISSFVAKLSPSGQWRWARGTVSGQNTNRSACYLSLRNDRRLLLSGAFRSDSLRVGNVLLLNAAGPAPANSSTDVMLAEIDSAGTWQWAVRGGWGNDEAVGPAHYFNGRLYVAGSFNASSAFGSFVQHSNGPSDMFVAQLDTLGGWQWVVPFGGSGGEYGSIVGFDTQQRLVISGSFNGPTCELPPLTLSSQPITGASTSFLARLNGPALLERVMHW